MNQNNFYVVSPLKFAVMNLGTCGMFVLYWFYRQWAGCKGSWPVLRAVFCVFFTHTLFNRVKASAPEQPQVAAWHNHWTATLLVLCFVSSSYASRSSDTSGTMSPGDLLALVLLLPETVLLLKAQVMINHASGDELGSSNNHLTSANYAWLAVGLLFWLLMIVGFTLSEPIAAPASGTGEGF